MRRRILLPLVVVWAAIMACQSTSVKTNRTFSLGNYWAVPGVQGGESAVYLTIVNSTGQADRLVSASTPVAESVELQETIMQDGQGILRPLAEGIPIDGSEILNLAPGGDHIQLIGLKRDLKPGDSFDLTLKFDSTGEMTVSVIVKG